MDKYVVLGVKKLFSLTKTKIRLAKEADTIYTRPKPLPLIKYLSGEVIETVSQAEQYREKMLGEICYSVGESVADAVFSCMDLIEGVKYKYEPPEYCFSLSGEELEGIEEESRMRGVPVNLLMMTCGSLPEGINLFVGENPPEGAYFVSGVPTSLAGFIFFALNSRHFSGGRRLRNINCFLGRRTLINRAVVYALCFYGVEFKQL